jgi:PDZ domain-containing protein
VFVVGGLILAVILVASSWITIPYYGIGPGPARDVTPLIAFDDRPRYDPSGRLVMTTVRSRHLTPVTALAAWLDPHVQIVEDDRLYPPNLDRQEEQRLSFSQMDQSKIDATAVVLGILAGYPDRHGTGALIEATRDGCPADGELFPGDVVTAIDGEPIDSLAEARRILDRAGEGDRLAFSLDVDGTPEDAIFRKERCIEGERDAFVGVTMLDTFPIPVQISSGEIGGPSAGLMWAIGLYELLTPGDLTGGRVIAGTGTIAIDGSVGGIGDVVDKVVGAREAGAEIFLVPEANADELAGVDTGDMEVVVVSSFDGALRALGAVVPGS